MGARPADFDERIVRMAPTFKKWQALKEGEKLRYACRDFIKGHGNDEERLMRRIMIARRNNLRDHELLKTARNARNGRDASSNVAATEADSSSLSKEAVLADVSTSQVVISGFAAMDSEGNADEKNNLSHGLKKRIRENTENHLTAPVLDNHVCGKTDKQPDPMVVTSNSGLLGPLIRKRPKTNNGMTDLQVKLEMDEMAVEGTRSYKAWLNVKDGMEFTYNQTYIKGREGHDWLLKKNIWRRMRYRRQNKKMVESLKVANNQKLNNPALAVVAVQNRKEDVISSKHMELKAAKIKNSEEETNDDPPGKSNILAMDTAAAAAASVETPPDLVNNAIVEAAVAAAASYVKDMPKVEDGLDTNIIASSRTENGDSKDTSHLQIDALNQITMV